MPSYDYRCQKCRETFTIERSMNDSTETECTLCGSGDVSRIWNMYIRAGGASNDAGKDFESSSKSGCGSCCSNSCGSC